MLVDRERDGLQRFGTDRMAGAPRITCEPQVEAEKPGIHHRTHGVHAVELGALFGHVVPHLGQQARNACNRACDVRIGRKSHERVGGPADADELADGNIGHIGFDHGSDRIIGGQLDGNGVTLAR